MADRLEALVFKANGDSTVVYIEEKDFINALKSLIRRPTNDQGSVWVEPVTIHKRKYTAPKGNEKMPWEMPGFIRGDDPEEPADEDAYGRKDLSNWQDIMTAWVHECGVPLKLPKNSHFAHMQMRSGHFLLGTVVLVRTLNENGCGDSVNLPVDKDLLDKLGLKDIRVPA
jgi:hypothetical protein